MQHIIHDRIKIVTTRATVWACFGGFGNSRASSRIVTGWRFGAMMRFHATSVFLV
jgi:hypothetical protein